MLKLATLCFVFAVYSIVSGFSSNSQLPLDIGRALLFGGAILTIISFTLNIASDTSTRALLYRR